MREAFQRNPQPIEQNHPTSACKVTRDIERYASRSMRTITALLALDSCVYVYLKGENLASIFLKNASSEGFAFGDGADPLSRETSDIFAVHDNFTINYVGFVGHMAFHSLSNNSRKPLIRVDYGKYISGRNDYIIYCRTETKV